MSLGFRRYCALAIPLQKHQLPGPLVKAALRAGLLLDRPTLMRICRENSAPAPVATGPVGKSKKRSVLKEDLVRSLMKKIFPELEEGSAEYTRIFEGINGKKASLSEEIADEVLYGVKALDPENAEKFSGLRGLAEKVDLQKRVQRELQTDGRQHTRNPSP